MLQVISVIKLRDMYWLYYDVKSQFQLVSCSLVRRNYKELPAISIRTE